jgi:xanthine dehydrogenase large subunit
VGWLTLEELRWDTSDGPHRGRLQTQSASTYKLPSFSEMPEEFHVRLFENAREEGAVYGSKAVGEPPFMLAFSAAKRSATPWRRSARPATRSIWAPRDAGGRVLGRPRRAGGRAAARRSPSAAARPRTASHRRRPHD